MSITKEENSAFVVNQNQNLVTGSGGGGVGAGGIIGSSEPHKEGMR